MNKLLFQTKNMKKDNKRLVLIFIFILLTFLSCKKAETTNKYNLIDNNVNTINGYENGTYCAEVEYYYSETGTRSTYTLNVEIEDNLLIKIYWPNGGWLDDSHFSPPEIEDGEATFSSDHGVDYTITILGEEGECTTSSYVNDEDDLVRDKEDKEYQERRNQEDEEDKIKKEKKELEKKQAEEEEENRIQEEEENQNN